MTIDERLSAVTMNLELTARDVADLNESVAGLHGTVAELHGTVAELHGSVADLRSSIDALTVGAGNLLRICESHERRLIRLETGTA